MSSQAWSLEELCAVCGIMNIPYVVVVQPHLLRDKGSVRLRRIQFDSRSTGSNSISEKFISLDRLPAAILAEHLEDFDHPGEPSEDVNAFDGQSGFAQSRQSGKSGRVECLFVDGDQFWGSEKQITKSENQNWKTILKGLKTISQRSEAYLENMTGSSTSNGTVVIAADLPFFVLREFGTTLMRSSETSASAASTETVERYPKYKRPLRTLSIAIDASMKNRGYWNSGNNSIQRGSSSSPSRDLMTILLYSRMDDRFDMISLGDTISRPQKDKEGNDSTSRSRRNDRKKGL